MKSVRGLIRFALDRGLIDKDPAPAYELPAVRTPSPVPCTDDELKGLFGDPMLGDIWRLYTHSCLRANELLWLRPEDVMSDSSGRPVALQIRAKTCPASGEAWRPKHRRERAVALTPVASAIVAQLLSSGSGTWLFPRPANGDEPARRWAYRDLLDRFHARLQFIGARRRGLHALRHTGATRLANDAKMPLAQLQKFLGHSSLRETQRYLHPSTDDIAATLAKVSLDPAEGGEAARK